MIQPSSPDEGGAADRQGEREPLAVEMNAVRLGGVRAMRGVGIALGLFCAVTLAAQLLGGYEPGGGPGATLMFSVGSGFGFLCWVIPRKRHEPFAALLIGFLAAITATGLWTIGPSMSGGAMLVVVPLLGTFFFGRRAALVGAAATGLLLAAVGIGSWLVGRPMVGVVEGAQLPFRIYVQLSIFTVGNALVALAAVRSMLGASERSLRGARDAAEREREEHQRRLGAERSLAQAKRLEAIGHLASGVAHDTRNALLVMAAGLKELRATPRSAEDREVLADVERALANVTQTMQQLLLLGRRQPSAARPVPLAAMVEPFVSALRRVIPPELEVRLEGRADTTVMVDPARLEQALLNLALNARDAMPGRGVLTVRMELRPGPEERAVVEVADTGNGMDERTAAHMFDPFFTTKPPGEGTGLGLALVQQFVTEAGGAIECETSVGRGTRVRLVFPTCAAEAGATAAGAAGR